MSSLTPESSWFHHTQHGLNTRTFIMIINTRDVIIISGNPGGNTRDSVIISCNTEEAWRRSHPCHHQIWFVLKIWFLGWRNLRFFFICLYVRKKNKRNILNDIRKSYWCYLNCLRNINNFIKKLTSTTKGLEPSIFRSEVGRLIH